MFELSVRNDKGEAYSLAEYTIYKIDGLTPPKTTINSVANVGNDGSVISSARVESRNIVIYLALHGDIEESRNKLYRYFPIAKTVTVFFRNGVRNVSIDGTVEVIECDIFGQRQTAQISILCPQPYFKDVNELVTSFGDVNSLFEFPFSITSAGDEISTLTANQRKSIINAGNIATGMVIKIFALGTIVNPIVYNVFSQKFMKLNTTLTASDEITINTSVGQKSITLLRDGATTNIIGCLSPDSDWLRLEAGDNVFTYDADSGTSNLQLTFRSSVLYGGV